VRSGETATQIARRYGVSLTRLLDYNGLAVASVIRAGDILKIPPAGPCPAGGSTSPLRC
jgi:LysM repeat protein